MEKNLENKMNKSILIITYKFPPMGGIGTRRWVKFAKYLSRKGYKVHILTVDYKYKDSTTWEYDVGDEIVIHKFKSNYPLWLLSESKNRIEMQFKRYSNFILKKLFFTLDMAQYDAKSLLTEAKKVISQYNIKNVIATGHPVSIHYIATYLKIDNPSINLIQDYRDNWNDLNVYGFGNREGFSFFRQKENSAYKEFFTIMYSDYIVNVSKDLTSQLRSKHKSINKFRTITNGFDRDDFKDIITVSNSFNMIYTGSLFNQRIEAINLILDALIELDDEYINKNFKLTIYSNYDEKRLDNKYSKLIRKNIVFKSFVSPEEIVKILATFSCCLSINSKFASYAFGTKIFDYMALNKKILHVSNGGILYDILEEKGQFVSRYSLAEMKQTLLNLKDDYIDSNRDNSVDYNTFSLEEISLEFEKLFI